MQHHPLVQKGGYIIKPLGVKPRHLCVLTLTNFLLLVLILTIPRNDEFRCCGPQISNNYICKIVSAKLFTYFVLVNLDLIYIFSEVYDLNIVIFKINILAIKTDVKPTSSSNQYFPLPCLG